LVPLPFSTCRYLGFFGTLFLPIDIAEAYSSVISAQVNVSEIVYPSSEYSVYLWRPQAPPPSPPLPPSSLFTRTQPFSPDSLP
jgi:hypothetical protein